MTLLHVLFNPKHCHICVCKGYDRTVFRIRLFRTGVDDEQSSKAQPHASTKRLLERHYSKAEGLFVPCADLDGHISKHTFLSDRRRIRRPPACGRDNELYKYFVAGLSHMTED